jgi:hypothetical protein
VARRRKKASFGVHPSVRWLGTDVRQVIVLLVALLGGGLSGIEGIINKKDVAGQGERTTATASLATNALEELATLREEVEDLRAEADGLQLEVKKMKRQMRSSGVGGSIGSADSSAVDSILFAAATKGVR